jgi:hypothetical protein
MTSPLQKYTPRPLVPFVPLDPKRTTRADMPAVRPATIAAITSVLDLDGTMSASRRQAVLHAIDPRYEPSQLVNASTVADALGLSKTAFSNWQSDLSRSFPFTQYLIEGSAEKPIIRFDMNEVAAYLESRKVPARRGRRKSNEQQAS